MLVKHLQLSCCEMFWFVADQIQCVGASLFQIGEISCPCPWCFAAANQTWAMFGLPIRRARAPRISQSGTSFQVPHIRTFPPAPAPLRKIHKGRGKYTPSLPPCHRLLVRKFLQLFFLKLNLLIRTSNVGLCFGRGVSKDERSSKIELSDRNCSY